jgi:hypothetical protein|tara:strand:- start:197 stop:439 length:243 start_codon:yes stop_codon:yes gene_type:complete
MSVANKALEQDKEIPEGDDGSFVILENVTSQKSGEEDDWMVKHYIMVLQTITQKSSSAILPATNIKASANPAVKDSQYSL